MINEKLSKYEFFKSPKFPLKTMALFNFFLFSSHTGEALCWGIELAQLDAVQHPFCDED